MATPDEKLERLWQRSPRRAVSPRERIVILSDLHMGDGGRNDDFRHNSQLFIDALEHYYWPRGYTLVLNGDIEELLRVPRDAILTAWTEVYVLFERFRTAGRLVWLKGNHEILPSRAGDPHYEDHFDGEGLVLETAEGPLFVFHGHQAGTANSGKFNSLIGWSLRFFANTLGIPNRTIAHDSVQKFKLEQAVHDFSRRRGLVSVIGHTHRPLFESLSKEESAGIRLERLCRDYAAAEPNRREKIRRTVSRLLADRGRRPTPRMGLTHLVYGDQPVPCVFNAGCAVGKRGFTTLELRGGKIALVFWSSPELSWRPGAYNEFRPARCFGEGSYRTILRRESLAYVFSRIELLGGAL